MRSLIRSFLAVASCIALAVAPPIAYAAQEQMTEGIVAVEKNETIADVLQTAAIIAVVSAPTDAPVAPVLRDGLTPAPASGLFVVAPT